jgi:hypothetical protein
MIFGKLLAWRIWLVGFRILCLGCIVLGSLVAIACSLVFVLQLIRPTFSVEISEPFVAIGAIMGTLFVFMGIKGLKIKTPDDVEAEIAALGSSREAWSAGSTSSANRLTIGSSDRGVASSVGQGGGR